MSGHSISCRAHEFLLCSSASALFNKTPHSHWMSAIRHSSLWLFRFALLTAAWHREHSVSSSPQHLTWSFAVFRGKRWWHHIHSPSTMASMLFAKRFWQKTTTDCRHIWQVIFPPPLVAWKVSTQNPQKLCPHGVAIWASNKGFLLWNKKNMMKMIRVREHCKSLIHLAKQLYFQLCD